MAILEIIKYPSPTLRESCKAIDTFDDHLRKLLDDMAETMYDAPGVGLAAPQVGKTIRAIVVNVGEDQQTAEPAKLYKLVNPKILVQSGEVDSEEGCLSIPGLTSVIKRSAEIVISGQNEFGKDLEIAAGGLLAICLQHEIDHLNGVLFIDHMSKLKRELVKKKLRRLEEEYMEVRG